VTWTNDVDARRIEAAEFRETIRGDIAELRQELRSELQQLRMDMQRQFYILGAGLLLNTLLSITAIVIALIALRR